MHGSLRGSAAGLPYGHACTAASRWNAEDAQRGLRDGLITAQEHDAIVKAIRERGNPPWNTRLGGEIMIHGAGADRAGTAGCVGMNDDDIRELYPALPEGTKVTIVP